MPEARSPASHFQSTMIKGFASNISRFIDDGVTVILFCNLDQISRPDVIAKEIASYYCPAIALY